VLPPDHPAFWASVAVQEDQDFLELSRFADSELYKLDLTSATMRAIHSARTPLCVERNKSYVQAQKRGVLLFAWEGSQVLNGGAA